MKRCLLLLASLSFVLLSRASEIRLTEAFNARQADFEGARPAIDQNARQGKLRVAGSELTRGLGTQVDTALALEVGAVTRITGTAGVDDATDATASVRFELIADDTVVWQAEVKKGDAPISFDVDLSGRKRLVLRTLDVGNASTAALADWLGVTLTYSGEKPKACPVPPVPETREILTPAAPEAPRINGPRVFGVRPGHPFLFTIPATGLRPMTFSAEGLPDGLALDAATGRISGQVAAPGTFAVTLRAKNERGISEAPLRVEIGERIALTPPLGWNSWNCWGVAVDQEKVFASAKAMAASGLIQHGWSYVNIDDTWQGARSGTDHALQPNAKFPDLGALSERVHALGLKLGIYSTPWITSYAGYPGGSADNPEGSWTKPNGPKAYNRDVKPWALGQHSFAVADARQWAAWGIDYLKYDWNPNRPPETKEMANALRASGRDIVYSLSNNAPFEYATELSALANCWRTTGDIHDAWGSVYRIWMQHEKWRAYARPGHWNDPDMLVVGPVDVGRGESLRPSRLTPNEQYTHISLWCLWSAPLLIGCPLESLDPFTLNLLTNDEVLAVDQDELGTSAEPVWSDGRKRAYVKPLADGSHAIGLFNLAQQAQEIVVPWSALKLAKPERLRDLWRQVNLSVDANGVRATVPRHGVVLLRAWPGDK